MLLTIDAGNTNIVFAVYDQARKQVGRWRVSTDVRRTADEYAVWLTHLMGLRKLRPIDISGAILGSVVPAATFHLVGLCRHTFGTDPMVIGTPGVDLGVEAKIDNPREAGADRLLNAVGASAVFPPPLIVLDIGTATTFDVVDADGNFAGGVIAPGPHPSLEALHNIAAKLPKIDIERPAHVIGRNTIESMQSGMFWGYIGMIEGTIARIKEEFGSRMTVIATGGLSKLYERATSVIDHIDDEITLRGLVLIHDRNVKK
jgi:type III pantothenate kinase